MRSFLTFSGAIVFGILGAIIGIITLSDRSVLLPGLGLIIAGWLIGSIIGFVVGAVIGLVIGRILDNSLAKSI